MAAARVDRRDDPLDRRRCSGERGGGTLSPASDCRSAGGACSLRRFGSSGATSASARAGVEP